jgi:hypothetical protein
MTHDDLLERLGEAARAQGAEEKERLDDRWDALAAGTLSAEEESRLRREASSDPALAAALEAFSPLGSEVRRRIADQARKELQLSESPHAGLPQAESRDWEASDSPVDPATLASGGGPKPWWIGAAASLVVALAAVFLWWPGQRLDLPPYEASLSGITQVVRGLPVDLGEGRSEVHLGNRFELLLTPRQQVTGSVAARAFLEGSDGRLEPWYPPVEISASGTVRIAGTVGTEIELPSGEVTLWLAVGRRRSLPSAEELRSTLGEEDDSGGEERGWYGWRFPLTVVKAQDPAP